MLLPILMSELQIEGGAVLLTPGALSVISASEGALKEKLTPAVKLHPEAK